MTPQPRALVIEDQTSHAMIAEVLLGELGFEVEVATSARAGHARARALLARGQPQAPTLILLDLKLPDPRVPSFEGSMLAAQLLEGMETGLLQPAHLVAITSEPTEQRRQEALLAGCCLVLTKPLSRPQAEELRALVDTPPAPQGAAADPARQLAQQLLRRASAQVIEGLQASSDLAEAVSAASAPRAERAEGVPPASAPAAISWDEERVRQLIFSPTALLRDELCQRWIRAHGGMDAVRARLAATPLPEDQRRMLEELLRSAPSWQSYTERFHIGRMTYYRHLKKLLVELASALNEW